MYMQIHLHKSVVAVVCIFETGFYFCIPGYLGTHSRDQAGLELRDPPASAFEVLRLKVCATTASHICLCTYEVEHRSLCT